MRHRRTPRGVNDPAAAREPLLKRIELYVGVVAGVLGVVVLLIGLPEKVASAIDRSGSSKTKLELEQKRAEVAAAGPRLDESYVFMNTNLYEGNDSSTDKPRGLPSAATTILAYPRIENEVIRQLNASGGAPASKGCGLSRYPQISVAYLVIKNRGLRDASDVNVGVERLRLAGPVRVREADVGGDDYKAKLRAGAKSAAAVTVRVPVTLGPADGIRVPLFMSAAAYGRNDRWCVVSRTAYLPSSMSFTDLALESTTEDAVRRMEDQIELANGIVGRG